MRRDLVPPVHKKTAPKWGGFIKRGLVLYLLLVQQLCFCRRPTRSIRVMRPARLAPSPTKPFTIPCRFPMTFIPAASPKTTCAKTSKPMIEVSTVKSPPMVDLTDGSHPEFGIQEGQRKAVTVRLFFFANTQGCLRKAACLPSATYLIHMHITTERQQKTYASAL